MRLMLGCLVQRSSSTALSKPEQRSRSVVAMERLPSLSPRIIIDQWYFRLRLIAAGALLDKQDTDGYTALHHAVFYNHGEVATTLSTAKAKIDMEDKSGCAPLHHAAYYGRPTTAKKSSLKAPRQILMRPTLGTVVTQVCSFIPAHNMQFKR